MFEIFINFFLRLFLSFFVAFVFLSCAEEEKVNFSIVDYHVERSNKALEAWQIDLATNKLAFSRYTAPNHQYNPPNWIMLTDDNCRGEGIPDAIKNNCPFSTPYVLDNTGEILGQTSIEYSSKEANGYFIGEIINTTIILKQSIQEGNLLSLSDKQSIYIHEIGHALGLSHTDSWQPISGDESSYVMYFDNSGADEPCTDELNAIVSVYSKFISILPSADPSPIYCPEEMKAKRSYSQYFATAECRGEETDCNGNEPLYHRNKPTFYIYPYSHYSTDLSFSVSNRPKPGKQLGFKPNVLNLYHYKDGSFKKEHINGQGKVIRSEYIKDAEHH